MGPDTSVIFGQEAGVSAKGSLGNLRHLTSRDVHSRSLSPFALFPCYIRRSAHGDGPLDPRFIDDLAKRLSAAVPPSVVALRRDLEDNFKAVLQAGLTKLDLVSRQEFDVQAAVLRRTREKLDALEKRVAEMEESNVTK